MIEAKPRLASISLAQEATAGRMKLDHSTQNLLAFNAEGSKAVPASATKQGDAKAEVDLMALNAIIPS